MTTQTQPEPACALLDATTFDQALAVLTPLSVYDARMAILDAYGPDAEDAASEAFKGYTSQAVMALGFTR
jgi:hypothetical protein